MTAISRRRLLGAGGLLAAGLRPLPAQEGSPKLRVIVTGGHPDDPMSGCGGTMARLADLGHDVVALCLTRGEAGIRGKSHEEAGAIRSEEARRSCETLKARLRFADQVDGRTEVSPARYDEFRKILDEEKPDLVFTHWPIDGHRDHRSTSLLVYDAWLKMKKGFDLCYYEGEIGDQTQHFSPTDYVDITGTEPRKRDALKVHHWFKNPPHLYSLNEATHRFRGMEAGCPLAEAFVRHVQSRRNLLPR